MKQRIFLLMLLGCTAAVHASYGLAQCAIQETPSSTLLLPYFEVDMSTPKGITTQATVANATAAPVLVEAVLWTDLGVPIFSFNLYLGAFANAQVDLRAILEGGTLPSTTPAPGQFPSCSGVLPPSPIPVITLASYQAAFTGQPIALFSGLCGGRSLGDSVARGYVTFDTVGSCTLQIPSDLGAFGAGGTGIFTNDSALFGDFQYADTSKHTAETHSLVHIVADASAPELSTSGLYTFYGRYVDWTAADNREPLGTEFAARYIAAGTDLIVWRDSKVNQGLFNCGTLPPWYPLGQESAFDISDTGAMTSLGAAKPFPAVAQRVHVGSAALPATYTAGWYGLDLNTSVASAGSNPPFDPTVAQAWVLTSSAFSTTQSSGMNAVRLDSACRPRHVGP
jgi:hypothetical protein